MMYEGAKDIPDDGRNQVINDAVEIEEPIDLATLEGDPHDLNWDQPHVSICDDWAWAMAQRENGAFDEFKGQFVAVADKRVIGSGPLDAPLRKKLIDQRRIDPARLVILFVDGA